MGEIPNTNARGVAVDPKSGHGFASSSPVAMWDTKTLALIKTIEVQGGPDGILFDPFNQRVWIFSHRAPNATIINTVDGTIAGTLDLGGAPEQAVTDGNGHLWVDIEDKDNVAAVDAKSLTVTAHYDLAGKCGGPAGLAFDAKNRILFAACHNPAVMAILGADDGKLITTLPINPGVDGAGFNPNTMEAFSSQGDGTLTVVKETSPTSFAVEQTVRTMTGGKTMTVDTKTNQIYIIAAEYGPAPRRPRSRHLGDAADGEDADRWSPIRSPSWWSASRPGAYFSGWSYAPMRRIQMLRKRTGLWWSWSIERILGRLRNVFGHLPVHHGSHGFLAVVHHHAVEEDREIGRLDELFAFETGRFENDVVDVPLAGLAGGIGERRPLAVNPAGLPIGIGGVVDGVQHLNLVAAHQQHAAIAAALAGAANIGRLGPLHVELAIAEFLAGQ